MTQRTRSPTNMATMSRNGDAVCQLPSPGSKGKAHAVISRLLTIAGLTALSLALPDIVGATPIDAGVAVDSSITTVANGCGPNRYRGPGGACHVYGRGPFPGGYYGPYGSNPAINQGCGAGRYRGPYGSCHKFGTGPYPGGYTGPYYR